MCGGKYHWSIIQYLHFVYQRFPVVDQEISNVLWRNYSSRIFASLLWGPKEHTCSSRKCWIPTNKTYMCTYFNTTNITSSTIFRCFLLYFLLYFPEVCTGNLLMEFFVCKEPDLICSLGLPMNRILYFPPNVKCSYFNLQETHKKIYFTFHWLFHTEKTPLII